MEKLIKAIISLITIVVFYQPLMKILNHPEEYPLHDFYLFSFLLMGIILFSLFHVIVGVIEVLQHKKT